MAFAGTPGLAATILMNLLETGRHTVEFVYTQPDRPAGRGRRLKPSPVKVLAQEWGLAVHQPETAAEMDPDNLLHGLDLLVVVAYGMILPADIISRPRLGCINIHMSLLPRWRGAAPIPRAIQAGDQETGVTIMQLDEGLDTGPVLAQVSCTIGPHDTSSDLQDRLGHLGAGCLAETLDRLAIGKITAIPQDNRLASYAHKITKTEAQLDWSRSASELERTIRAFNPYPVAYSEFKSQIFRIWEAEVLQRDCTATPGTIVACGREGLEICTGDGILRLLRIQPAGKRPMTVAEFINGQPDFFVNQ